MIVISTPLGPIVKCSPRPESQQHDTPRAESQNLPDVINLEGPSPGHSDAEIGVEDGLSDSNPDKLPENEEVVPFRTCRGSHLHCRKHSARQFVWRMRKQKRKEKRQRHTSGTRKRPSPSMRRLAKCWHRRVFTISFPSFP